MFGERLERFILSDLSESLMVTHFGERFAHIAHF